MRTSWWHLWLICCLICFLAKASSFLLCMLEMHRRQQTTPQKHIVQRACKSLTAAFLLSLVFCNFEILSHLLWLLSQTTVMGSSTGSLSSGGTSPGDRDIQKSEISVSHCIPSFEYVYHVCILAFKSVYHMCVPPFSHSAVRFFALFST